MSYFISHTIGPNDLSNHKQQTPTNSWK